MRFSARVSAERVKFYILQLRYRIIFVVSFLILFKDMMYVPHVIELAERASLDIGDP